MRKNDIINLEITGLSHEGSGVGRFEGMVVFVPKSAIGDVLQVKIVKVQKTMAFGIIEEIISPSYQRIENDCPYYQTCGGCSLRHISPEAELAAKDDMTKSNLVKIGKVNIAHDAPKDCPSYYRYRNKAAFPVQNLDGKMIFGFYAKRSHRVIEIADCLLQPKFFIHIAKEICIFCDDKKIPAYDEAYHKGLLRHIIIRYAEATDQIMLTLVINGDDLPFKTELIAVLTEKFGNIKTIVLNINKHKTNSIEGRYKKTIFGEGYITDILCGIKIRISSGAFYQVNRKGAEILYSVAKEYADINKNDVVLDLYCGAGTIGLSLAGEVKQLIGVEVVKSAVEDAQVNAEQNQIDNARFLCMDAGEASKKLLEEGLHPNLVIADPPRAGLDADAVNYVCEMLPERIVYVSCNSSTLARDCAIFESRGYKAVKACSVNMFARTTHVECVVLMVRVDL